MPVTLVSGTQPKVTTHGIALHFLWAFAVRGGTQTHPESQAWHLIIIFSISQKIFWEIFLFYL
jgi:hypothetical protein